MTASRLPCADFLNRSDAGLIWWQALQREAVFIPQDVNLFINDSDNGCQRAEPINFYIFTHRDKLFPCIDFNHGGRLRQRYNNYVSDINVCFITNPHDLNNDELTIANIAYSFLHCLRDYGEGIDKYLPFFQLLTRLK